MNEENLTFPSAGGINNALMRWMIISPVCPALLI